MNAGYLGWALASVVLSAWPAAAEVRTRAVEYKHGDTVLEGYLAYDDRAQGARPGVLVFHEWKGLNDYAKTRARQLAALGYVAFAADMYGKGILAKDHEEAARLAGAVRGDRKLMRARAQAALDTLKAQEGVAAAKVAAIGYCFGGTTVLEMARAGQPLAAVASFHGSLDTPMPAEEGAVRAYVAAFHGGSDKFVKKEAVDAFQEEMKAAGASWELVVYGDAVHSFTVPEAGDDPAMGMAYNENADKRSWAALQDLLKDKFR